MKITLETLKKLNACETQLDKFQELFPSGEVIPTIELAEKYAHFFDWYWAAQSLLSINSYFEFFKIEHVAYDEYREIRRVAWNEYEKFLETKWNKYNKIKKAAWDEYQKKIALAFVTLYIKENS